MSKKEKEFSSENEHETESTINFEKDTNNEQAETESNAISFDDSKPNPDYDGYGYSEPEVTVKKKKRISIKALVTSLIVGIVAAVMLTYSICSSVYKTMYAKAYTDANANTSLAVSEFDLLKDIINFYSYNNKNLDYEEMMSAAMNAYLAQTGDIYAKYYSQQDLAELQNDTEGKFVGIGINIINDTVELNGKELLVLNIVNVMENSSALEVGIKTGDLIFEVEANGIMEPVDIETSTKFTGPAGSTIKFSVLRKSGDTYETLTFTATRRELTTSSIFSRVYELDSTVGIIRISTFDDTTPQQFDKAVSDLKAKGCTRFVLDLRYNFGGSLDSMEKLLSFFLKKGDVFVQMKNNTGEAFKYKIAEKSHFAAEGSACSIKAEEIGKYNELPIVLLCNEYTASAAEAFIAALRDHSLAHVIGTNTYGKASVQSLLPFNLFIPNALGAVALTTDELLTPNGTRFNNVGIKLDADKVVDLSDEAKNHSIYTLPDKLDNQLQKAIEYFIK